jgi:predicted nucleotidyltransferase
MAGMTAEGVREAVREVLRKTPIVRVGVLFGSAAQDRLASRSDVDVAVAADARLSPEERVQLALELERRVHRQVDLLDLRALRGLILYEVLTKGVVVKNEDTTYLGRLYKDAVFYEADMMPLWRRMALAKARRFAYGHGPHPQEAGSPGALHPPDRVQTAG